MKLMYVGAALVVLQVGSMAQAQELISHDSFYWLTEINKASIVMLVEQGIVPQQLGVTIARNNFV